ncbi:DUF2321 domain-containing protein [Allostella humosa]|nr:DUF2321 domain-containing protein [Stella humosa]
MAEDSPGLLSKYCGQCGAATILKCPSCQAGIRGYFYVPGVISISEYHPPSFCFSCGSAFPWTASRLRAAEDLVDEMDELSDDEKRTLKQSVAEMTRDTSATELASVRYKKLLGKAGKGIGTALNSVTVSVITEAAKRLLL